MWIIGGMLILLQITSMVIGFSFIGAIARGEDVLRSLQFQQHFSYLVLMAAAVFGAVIDSAQYGFSLWRSFGVSFRPLIRSLPELAGYAFFIAAIDFFLLWLAGEPSLLLQKHDTELVNLTFFSVVIAAPIGEEILFRGYLYPAMCGRFLRRRERLVVNATLFSLAHVLFLVTQPVYDVPLNIFVIGYFLARLYEKHRSILPPIALHMFNNFFVFTVEWIVYL